MTLKCRCGFDSGVAVAEGSFNVGQRQKETGMFFVFLQDGESVFICATCNQKAQEAIAIVSSIVGSDHWVPSSMIRRRESART